MSKRKFKFLKNANKKFRVNSIFVNFERNIAIIFFMTTFFSAEEDHTWNRVKRETYYLGMRNGGGSTNGGSTTYRRDNFRMAGHSKSFGQTKSTGSDNEPKVYIKPR